MSDLTPAEQAQAEIHYRLQRQRNHETVVKLKEKNAKAKAQAKSKPKPASKAKPQSKKTIGAFCSDLLIQGYTDCEILQYVREEFPKAKTSKASLAWYRNKLKKDGKLS